MPPTVRRIPRPTAQRLSLYLREIQPLIAQGQPTLSSRELGEKLGLSSAQVRKDLAWVVQSRQASEAGRAGVGYNCVKMNESIRRVIGANRRWSTVLVGVGNIGRALLAYGGFAQDGFLISAIFDANPRMEGKRIGTLKVQPTSALRKAIRTHRVAIGILAVPRSAAQSVATQLCDAGIRGILNFAPMRISVTEGVSVTNIDVSVALEQLSMDVSIRDQMRLISEGAA
ncbi:MAG: redox-sensing transcriptional repressor Rex [Planctomycetota bacterium]|nr:redox-sensing transcriptional repressor Rex [Planctomycetota bacterium]MDA1261388.1 redox-sensing transcriptional repressor Rex [Planctomycetota bacterium]